MKRLLTALALTGLLAGSAMAGDISTSGAPAPGGIPSDGATGQIASGRTAERVSDAALSAVLAALSLLS
jgi:hypothetical protein